MPWSSSAWPAGCIFGLSFFEPMMIPTSGASTSISSNALSTSGIGSVVAVSASLRCVPSGSAISIDLLLLGCLVRGHRADGPLGDVRAPLHAVERNHVRRLVDAVPRLLGGRTERGDVQDPAARRDDVSVTSSGARVQHLYVG